MTSEKEGRRVVKAEEILGKIERGEDVEYEGVTIGQGLDLTRLILPKDGDGKLIVSSSIKIVRSHIQGIVNFEDVVFKEFIDFRNSKFDLASFQGAKFCKYAAFESTIFGGYGQFSHVHFIGDAIFSNVQFIGDADFCEAKFKGDAFFWSMDDGKTTFSGVARFEFVEFCNHVTFHQATFCEKADFQLARFSGKDALFMGAHFEDGADFRGVRFEGAADFRWSKLNKYLNLTRAKIITFEVEWESIRYILKCDETVYLALVNSFKNLGRLDDADSCYYQYRRMSQNEKPWYEKKKKWLHRFNWSKLYDHVSYASCGYGVRLRFPLAWIFGSVFVFGILYSNMYQLNSINIIILDFIKIGTLTTILVLGKVSKFDHLDSYLTSVLDQTYNALIQNIYNIGDSIYLSAMIFTGQTPVNFQPVGAWKYAVMFESVLGYLFLALFIVVLARKLIR